MKIAMRFMFALLLVATVFLYKPAKANAAGGNCSDPSVLQQIETSCTETCQVICEGAAQSCLAGCGTPGTLGYQDCANGCQAQYTGCIDSCIGPCIEDQCEALGG